MKVLGSLSVLLVLIVAANLTLADRADSLQVFPQLKRARKVQFGATDFLSSAQTEVLLLEEGYIRSSIQDESDVLNQLTGADVQASGPQCLEFIRKSTNLLVNLGGISYTNCLNDADEKLFKELSEIPNLTITREQYDQFNLLGAFRGENIFVDPSKIRDKLAARMQTRINLPNLAPETTDAIRIIFSELKVSFRSCMTNARSKLAGNLDFTKKQIRAVCAAETSKHN